MSWRTWRGRRFPLALLTDRVLAELVRLRGTGDIVSRGNPDNMRVTEGAKVELSEPPTRAAGGRRTVELTKLFEAHNRKLVSFLARRLGNEAEAREVAQEAYVRVLQLDQPGAVS